MYYWAWSAQVQIIAFNIIWWKILMFLSVYQHLQYISYLQSKVASNQIT